MEVDLFLIPMTNLQVSEGTVLVKKGQNIKIHIYIYLDSHIYIKIHKYIYRFICIYQDSYLYIKTHIYTCKDSYVYINAIYITQDGIYVSSSYFCLTRHFLASRLIHIYQDLSLLL